MSNYLNNVIKISEENYQTLKGGGTVTKDGQSHQYQNNTLYLVEHDFSKTPLAENSNKLGNIDAEDYVTHDWLKENQEKIAVLSKSYTGVYCTNTSYPYYMFLRLVPNNETDIWHVRYRMFISNPTYNTYRGHYLVEFWGYGKTTACYKIWNAKETNVTYYHTAMVGKTAANATSYGNFFGIYLDSNSNGNKVAYARDVTVEVVDYDNCSVELLDNIVNYYSDTITVKVNGTDTTFKITTYCDGGTYNATTNGLQESSDNDSYYLGYVNGARYIAGSRISRYTLLGFDKDNKAQQFSFYGTSYSTSAVTKASGTRTYNDVGFDWTKGIFYYGTTTATASGGTITASLYYYNSAPDFRYTDNCLAASEANELGFNATGRIYLRGTIEDDGLFHLAPMEVTYNNNVYERAWTQTIPTEEDGYVYWFVGWPYYNSSYPNSLYQIALSLDNKLYWFKNGRFREYAADVNNISGAVTLDGTINGTEIPTNATLITDSNITQYALDAIRNINFSNLNTLSKNLIGAINEVKTNSINLGTINDDSSATTYYGIISKITETENKLVHIGEADDSYTEGNSSTYTFFSLYNLLNQFNSENSDIFSKFRAAIGLDSSLESPFENASLVDMIVGLKESKVTKLGELTDVAVEASSNTAAAKNTILIKTFGSKNWTPMDVDDVLNFGMLTSAEMTNTDASGNPGSFLKLTFSTGDSVYADMSVMTSASLNEILDRLTALEEKFVLLDETTLEQMYLAGALDPSKIYFGYDDTTTIGNISADGKTLTIMGAYLNEAQDTLILPEGAGVLSFDGKTLTI